MLEYGLRLSFLGSFKINWYLTKYQLFILIMFTQMYLKDLAKLFQKMMAVVQKLMNESILKFGNSQFRLAEIEFYLYNDQEFEDHTTHKNRRQLTS